MDRAITSFATPKRTSKKSVSLFLIIILAMSVMTTTTLLQRQESDDVPSNLPAPVRISYDTHSPILIDVNDVGATKSGVDYWGMAETFWNVSTGTDAPASFGDMTLFQQTNTDSVVLDGWLWEMTKTSMVGTVARFSPSSPATRTNDWNISAEITRPREDSAYLAYGISAQAGNQSLTIYLTNQSGFILAGVNLTTGSYFGESIHVYDASSAVWLQVADDIRPAFRHDFEGYGFRPDRYVVSFAHISFSSEATIAVQNTATGVVFVGNVTLPTLDGVDSPQLRFDIDSVVENVASAVFTGGWIIDNLMFRSAESMYPIIGPAYEVVAKQDPLWLDIRDVGGRPIIGAHVSIGGISATYDTDKGRYEAYLDRAVDWDVPIPYSVLVDGVLVNDILKVSTAPNPVNKISLPRWWNGWDWVTVIGKDDSSSPLSAPQMFSAYDHPKTSYISTGFYGNSTSLLETQSEIAIHYPHDYRYWGHKFWDEAVASSDAGHSIFENSYWFASRWDDPRYVGEGDMYISLGNPGNSGSWEQMFAQYARGTRVMGICSQYFLGGNSSLIGSYWTYPFGAVIPDWASWHPDSRMDMMDINRGLNTDITNPREWIISHSIAQAGGVLRIYSHNAISDPAYMSWLCNDKTNLSYENWKATDGEVASYVYGSRSTEVLYNSSSTNHTWIYDVSRRSPFAAGYWNVPVTVAIDISGQEILDVEIKSGPSSLRMSDESLRDLQGNRTMDVGFDIRGNTLYVSHFWNSSSSLILSVESPNSHPIASFEVYPSIGDMGTIFSVDASSSSDLEDDVANLTFRWDWEDDGTWDTDLTTEKAAAHQYSVPGAYIIRLEVIDTGLLSDQTTAQVEAVDDGDPSTSAQLSGTLGEDGWYLCEVEVLLEADDDWSDIDCTQFRISEGDWQTYSESFEVSDDGIHTLEYYSEDGAGNIEDIQSTQIKIDCTAPLLDITTENGTVFDNDTVNITLACSDLCSGVDCVEYSLDNGAYVVCESETCIQLSDLSNGTHQLSVRIHDQAGNEATQELTFEVSIAADEDNGDEDNGDEDNGDEDNGDEDTPADTGSDWPTVGAVIAIVAAAIVVAAAFAMRGRGEKRSE